MIDRRSDVNLTACFYIDKSNNHTKYPHHTFFVCKEIYTFAVVSYNSPHQNFIFHFQVLHFKKLKRWGSQPWGSLPFILECSPEEEIQKFLKRFTTELREAVQSEIQGIEPLYAVTHIGQLSNGGGMHCPHIHILWGIKK